MKEGGKSFRRLSLSLGINSWSLLMLVVQAMLVG